jgi:uncharacterized membrane-anchored protein
MLSVNRSWSAICALFLNLFALQALSDENAADSKDAAFDEAAIAVQNAQREGPVDIELRNQATLKLPEGFAFVPEKESRQLLKAMGNGEAGESLLGLVLPLDGEQGWFVVARFEESGYIKDDDAKDWDAEELLESLKAGTEENNIERKELGFPEIELIGWVEKPRYDAGSHQLKWSVSSKDKGATDDSENGINYNTYVLGREGYISLNLVTGMSVIDAQKPIAQTLLNALTFNNGKAYGDFDSNTDKVAAYGLTALVAGVAAKKLGLVAVVLAFLAKFFKVIAVGVVAAIAVIRKFFKRKEVDQNIG